MPPIKRTKALFFPSFHIGEGARNGHSGGYWLKGEARCDRAAAIAGLHIFERSFVSDSASLK